MHEREFLYSFHECKLFVLNVVRFVPSEDQVDISAEMLPLGGWFKGTRPAGFSTPFQSEPNALGIFLYGSPESFCWYSLGCHEGFPLAASRFPLEVHFLWCYVSLTSKTMWCQHIPKNKYRAKQCTMALKFSLWTEPFVVCLFFLSFIFWFCETRSVHVAWFRPAFPVLLLQLPEY